MTREYLARVKDLDQSVDCILQQIEDLNSMVTNITATMSDMPKSPSRNIRSGEDIKIKIADLQKEADKIEDEFYDCKMNAISAIGHLSQLQHRQVLNKKYIEYRTMPEIAKALGYSVRQIYRLHDEALEAIADF